MPLRTFKLPDDTKTLIDLIPPAFQYPENPAWSVQNDQIEAMVDTMTSVRRLWPILRAIQIISPPFRDALLGFIWKEDEKPVGMVNVMRQGMSEHWYIGNVAVLPEYRRRGIARKLVEACIQLGRERHGQSIVLDVIDGNLPAYQLYEKLGFERFTGSTEFVYSSAEMPPECPLPKGYTMTPFDRFNWRARYELAKRITPQSVQKYQPVEESLFRQPALFRALAPALEGINGAKSEVMAVRAVSGEMVGLASYSARYRSGGVNSIGIRLDSAHLALAEYLIHDLVRKTMALSPGRRIEFHTPGWQPELGQAALAAGFTRRFDTHTMGRLLDD